MIPAPIPANDAERLDSLYRMDLVSTPREPDLDRLVRLARSHFDVEMALISLVDKDRQWFKARLRARCLRNLAGHLFLRPRHP